MAPPHAGHEPPSAAGAAAESSTETTADPGGHEPPRAAPDVTRSCASKRRYDTEDIAKRVALECWYERRVSLRAYACDVDGCGGFHLTRRDAAPVMRPGWRSPAKSRRELARERRAKRRRR